MAVGTGLAVGVQSRIWKGGMGVTGSFKCRLPVRILRIAQVPIHNFCPSWGQCCKIEPQTPGRREGHQNP